MQFEDLTSALLDAAKKAGAEQAAAIAATARDVSVSVREGALEEAEGAEGTAAPPAGRCIE